MQLPENIENKLTEQLDRIYYEQKRAKGEVLNQDDVDLIFETLKKQDSELLPLLETFEKLVDKVFESDHYFTRNMIRELLEYYNIIDNENLMKTRHKFFFTESKQLIKKPYLSEKSLEHVKNIFNTHKIFQKV